MSRVQSILSWRRRRGAAILLIAVNLMVSASRAYASCWAENPTGQRKCGFFKSRAGNLDLWLCEDKQGDCASLGYTPLPTLRLKTPAKSRRQLATPSPVAKPTPPSGEARALEKKPASVEPANDGTNFALTNTPMATDTPAYDNAASDSAGGTFAALFFCFLLVGGAAFGLGWLLELRH